MADFVLIHGVGGPASESGWLTSLNHALGQMGLPTVKQGVDQVIAVEYSHCFSPSNDEISAPSHTVRPADEQVRASANLQFALAQQEMLRRLRTDEQSQRAGFAWAPDFFQDPVGQGAEFFGPLNQVTRYLNESRVRYGIWKEVRAALTRTQNPIVIAHSLGSVVAADVLGRLPEGVVIDLLVTVGSPLRHSRYRRHAPSEFPYWALRRWLNVYNPGDVVSGGGGIARTVPQAVDVSAPLGVTHTLPAYMGSLPVASTVGWRAFGAGQTENNGACLDIRGTPVARRVHESWYPLLLATTFTGQIANDLPEKSWQLRLRLRHAREEVARRAADNIGHSAEQRLDQLEGLRNGGFVADDVSTDDHPLAPGRYPTFADLSAGSAPLLAGMMTDQDLLTFSIALMLQPLVPPFDLRIDESRRSVGLEDTLNVVRTSSRSAGTGLSDRKFASEIVDALDWAKGELSRTGFPWGAVLIGSGVVLLAATGVGAIVAAPVGLAGAAVVTSTLAAVGPGGMVGGLATLGALTGTGASLTALGVREEFAGAAGEREEMINALGRSGRDLIAEPLPRMRVTLTASVAVVKAQQKLNLISSAESVRVSFGAALDAAQAERRLHRDVAPDGKSVDEWDDKVELIERALSVLDGLALGPRGSGERQAVADQVRSGTPPALVHHFNSE